MYEIVFNKKQYWDFDSISEALSFCNPDCGFENEEWKRDFKPEIYNIDAQGDSFKFDIEVDTKNQVLTITRI
jgi:hypothetical protein